MTPGPREPEPTADESPRVALLEADPELGRYITEDELPRARRAVTVPLLVIPEGTFVPAEEFGRIGLHPFAALVISGLISRELSVGGQATLRLLGPGDLVRCDNLELGLLVPEESYTASLPTHLAVLDDRFLQAVRHWPRLLTALVERTGEHHDATLVQLAISQQPRVEDRLVTLFRALAERWGRMTPSGVIVSLSLTHEALGRLIGARRPTVTLALKALARDERLTRGRDGAWLLTDVDSKLATEALRPLAGAARPRVLPEVPADETRFTRGITDPALIAQMRWLRRTHETLRGRLAELSERNEATCAQTRELIAASQARREARRAAG